MSDLLDSVHDPHRGPRPSRGPRLGPGERPHLRRRRGRADLRGVARRRRRTGGRHRRRHPGPRRRRRRHRSTPATRVAPRWCASTRATAASRSTRRARRERPMIEPNYCAFDAAGNLYVTDSSDWEEQNGVIYRVAPGGETVVWTEALRRYPNGCCLGARRELALRRRVEPAGHLAGARSATTERPASRRRWSSCRTPTCPTASLSTTRAGCTSPATGPTASTGSSPAGRSRCSPTTRAGSS